MAKHEEGGPVGAPPGYGPWALPATVRQTGPADLAELGETVRRKIKQVLGGSLHIRHMDAGSCNGCDWEIAHLLGAVYDIQRLGIDFVASPRHADMLLVTGPVTRHLEPALLATYEACGRPRLVVAVGACAIGGGIHGASYATVGGVDQVVPVDVYVPGCPPKPAALLQGILLALDKWGASPLVR